ncbi:MAG: circularly permuted type 2 ATP-grasp protein [Acidianus infernus]|nr:circularly permuted type 2 ATP-grasp protein [Acidianus infernus]
MMGFDPPKGIYVYIFGEDLVKVKGIPYILEDNVRIPSGMSYAIKANELTERVLGDKFSVKGDGLEQLSKDRQHRVQHTAKINTITINSLTSNYSSYFR